MSSQSIPLLVFIPTKPPIKEALIMFSANHYTVQSGAVVAALCRKPDLLDGGGGARSIVYCWGRLPTIIKSVK